MADIKREDREVGPAENKRLTAAPVLVLIPDNRRAGRCKLEYDADLGALSRTKVNRGGGGFCKERIKVEEVH